MNAQKKRAILICIMKHLLAVKVLWQLTMATYAFSYIHFSLFNFDFSHINIYHFLESRDAFNNFIQMKRERKEHIQLGLAKKGVRHPNWNIIDFRQKFILNEIRACRRTKRKKILSITVWHGSHKANSMWYRADTMLFLGYRDFALHRNWRN